jgi:spore maturation protein CgeB
MPLRIVILGLSLSSSWGNGHATTYRGLVKALAGRGHEVLFLERDVPWYAGNRDLRDPSYCRLRFYQDLPGLSAFLPDIASADAVIVGSYVPEGIAVGRLVQRHARGITAFYDIDTPITLLALEAGKTDYITPELIPGYDLYLSFTGGPLLEEIGQRYGAPRVVELPCSADPAAFPPRRAKQRWDLTYVGTYSPDRQPALTELLLEPALRRPELRFAVAGPQYPDDIAWPANVERISHLGPADLPGFYAASRFTLNITRAAMVAAGFSPSVRLFEASACGTAVISDRWAGIEHYLTPGREILLAATAADVVGWLSRPDCAKAVGAAARQRVLREHTAAHRAMALERHLDAAASAARQRGPGATMRLAASPG